MYFDDAISDAVLAQAPYSEYRGQRNATNTTDGIYGNGGNDLMLALSESDNGYVGALHIGLDLADTSVAAADANSGGGPGGFGSRPGGDSRQP
jgi:hypothetical protein